MANHVRRQIRDAAIASGVLGNLSTSGTRCYASRVYKMEDANLPGLRVYTNEESVEIGSLGVSRTNARTLELVVEACSKKASGMDDELDSMIKEVEVAIAANQSLGGAKYAQLRRIDIELSGEAEKQIGVARMTFEVLYYTALATPHVAQ